MIRRFLIYALALVPLVVVSSLIFPYITGRVLVFRALVDGSLAVFLYTALRGGVILRCSPILLAFSAIIVTIGVSTLLAQNRMLAFWSGLERMEGYVLLLHLFALFIVAGAVFCRERDWKCFFDCWLAAGTVVTGFSCFQLYMAWDFYGAGMRFFSSLGAPVYLGTFALWQLGIAVWRLTQRPRLPWAYWAAVPINVVAMYASGARAAMLGSIAGLAVTVFLLSRARHKMAALILLLALGIGGLVVLGVAEKNRLATRISDVVHGQDVSTSTHLAVWRQALVGIRARPLFGWGMEGDRMVDITYPSKGVDVGITHTDRAHDILLEWLVDGGVVGLLAYLSIWAAAVGAVWKLPATERAVLSGLGVAYFVNLLFVFDSINSYIPFVMMLGYLHFQTASWPQRFKPWTLDRVSAGALALGCGVWLLSAVNSGALMAAKIAMTMLGPYR